MIPHHPDDDDQCRPHHHWEKLKPQTWWWWNWKCLAIEKGIENCAENTSAKNWQKCRPKNGEGEELTVLMKAFGPSEEKNRHQVRSQVWTSFCPNISNRKLELTCAKRQTLEWRPGIKTVCGVHPPPLLYIQQKDHILTPQNLIL